MQVAGETPATDNEIIKMLTAILNTTKNNKCRIQFEKRIKERLFLILNTTNSEGITNS